MEGFAAQLNAGQLGNGNVDESLDPMDFVLVSFAGEEIFCNLVLLTMQSPLLMFLLSTLFAASTHEEILRQQTSVVYPLDPEW